MADRKNKKMADRKNKTLMLLAMVAVGIVVIGGLGLYSYNWFQMRDNKAAAMVNAKTYAKELGWKISGATCTNKDKDGDGYVSCTVQRANGRTEDLNCVGAVSMFEFAPNTGCKAKVIALPGMVK